MKTKYNLGKLWFPKIINFWNYISYYILFDIKLSTSDKFFIFQILSIGDNSKVENSLFHLEINWEEEFHFKLNLLYLFHLEYEYYNQSDKHSQIYNILENSEYQKNYYNSRMYLKWLKVHQHKSIGINKYIEIRFGEDLSKHDIIYLLKFNGIEKFKLKQIDESHFKIYNY